MVRPSQAAVYGVISLVFWAITSIVSIKYVTFALYGLVLSEIRPGHKPAR